MQTRSLETLIRIAQVQSFSQAAELQHMTLSALSMQMKALEAELGVALFDRSFRPPKLTPLGHQVAQQARVVVGQAEALQNLCLSKDRLVGRFRLGFIQSASVRILPSFIELVQRETPNATFLYTTGLSEALVEQVTNSQLDAAIVTLVENTGDDLRYDEIVSEDLALAVPAAFADTDIALLPQQLTFIHFMPTTGIGRLIAAQLQTLPRKPKQTLVLDGIESALECVKRGIGYTILPLPDIERHRDAKIFVHTAGSSKLKRKLALATRKDVQSDLWRDKLLGLFVTSVQTGQGLDRMGQGPQL